MSKGEVKNPATDGRVKNERQYKQRKEQNAQRNKK